MLLQAGGIEALRVGMLGRGRLKKEGGSKRKAPTLWSLVCREILEVFPI